MTDTMERITAEIAQAVARIAETDAELATGYSRVKAQVIARYAVLIGEAYATGELSEEDFGAEVEELDRMAERFVRNIRALAHTSLERLFGAVSEILRGAIGATALSLGAVPPELALPHL